MRHSIQLLLFTVLASLGLVLAGCNSQPGDQSQPGNQPSMNQPPENQQPANQPSLNQPSANQPSRSRSSMNETPMNRTPMNQPATNQSSEGAGQAVSDTWITTKVKAELTTTNGLGSTTDISVDTDHGVVTLTGVLPDKSDVKKAVAAAKSVKGVKRVDSSGLKVK